jgi:hypothetical protein
VAVLERGETQDTKVSIAFAIARLFGVPLEWLADDEQGWPPPKTDEQSASELLQQVLESAGLVGQLSPEESNFLSLIRTIHPIDRARLLGWLLRAGGRGFEIGDVDPFLKDGSLPPKKNPPE